MPAPVFYSVCPFGTGTIETGAGNITIASGVATLTVEQIGNIGVGVAIEYNSLIAYIAPNRIGFDSGGTTELLPDTKIEDATSGATGIVRYVELLSGTWAGGDAAGWIYFEKTTGTFGDNNIINRTKPTSFANIATVDGTIEGNIGNGNTEFVVKSAVGADAANQTETAVTSIHHEYASLSAFDAGFFDANHINDADLTNADVVAHACCYYDHDNYTLDIGASISGFTEDATRFLQVFAPAGGAESINRQRHLGVWDNEKYALVASETTGVVRTLEAFNRFDGLQISNTSSGTSSSCLDLGNNASITQNGYFKVTNTICKSGNSATNSIFIHDTNSYGIVFIANSLIYCPLTQGGGSEGVFFDLGTSVDIYHCTVYNFNDGIERDVGTTTVKNTAVFNNSDDFDNGAQMTIDYCASDDGDGTNAQQFTAEAIDWAANFTDYANGDFSLKDYTTNPCCIDNGTSLAVSQGIWRDIAGNERGATPDIGAFEQVAAGGVTVSCTLGSISIAGINPSLSIGTDIDSTLGAITIAGFNPTISVGIGINCSLGAAVIDGLDADIIPGIDVNCIAGQIDILGFNATVNISTGTDVDCTLGAVSIEGFAPTIPVGSTINAEAGAITILGFSPAISVGTTVRCSKGSVDIDKFNPEISIGTNIGCNAGALSILGFDTTIDLGTLVNSTLGQLDIAGQNANISEGINIDCSKGSVDIAGLNADVDLGVTIYPNVGTVDISGFDAAIVLTTIINVGLGIIDTNGLDAFVQIGELESSPFERTLTIEAENRRLSIANENRVYPIDAENRTLTITE